MLKINDLTCGYDSNPIIKEITFNLNRGEILGIIGPNGSGKTTLLRGMTRLIKPDSGTIFFEERDIWETDIKDLARSIAVVPQGGAVSDMSVEEFVLLGRIPHYKKFQFFDTKRDRTVSERSMGLTDTLRFRGRSILEMSGGERQLIFIARALAQEPKLLLLDEPTTYLDITHQVSILDLVRRLNRELQLTVIMVLHDLNLASEYCDRLLLLSQGSLHSLGTPEEIIDYKIIEEVYKTKVVIGHSPVSSKPYSFLVPGEA